MIRSTRPAIARYGLAAGSAGAAMGLRMLATPIVDPATPYTFFYPAVMIAGWYGGFGPGTFSMLLSVVAIQLFFRTSPTAPSTHDEIIRLATFITVSVMMSAMNELLVRARLRAERSADEARGHEREIRRSEERFRLAAEAVNGIIYEWELAGDTVIRSRGLVEVLGYEPGEVPPTLAWWHEQIHPDDLPAVRERFAEAMASSDHVENEFRIRNRDGYYHHVWDRAQIVRDHDGKPVRVVGCTVDVTDKKHAEAEREQLLRLERDASHAAERAQERWAFLAEASAILASSLDHRATLFYLSNLVIGSLSDCCIIALGDEAGAVRETVIAHCDVDEEGVPEECSTAFDPDSLNRSRVVADLLRSRRSLFIRVVPESYIESGAFSGELRTLMRRLAPKSLIMVPMVVGDRVLGVIIVVRVEPSPLFNDEDLLACEDLARRAALAVENAELYESERRQRELAERAAERTAALQRMTELLASALTTRQVLDVTIEHAVAVMGAGVGNIFLADERAGALVMMRSAGYDSDTITGWERIPVDMEIPPCDAFRSGEPLWIESLSELLERYPHLWGVRGADQSEACACIPLFVNGRPYGTVGLGFRETRRFSDEEKEFALALVGQCSQAIERALLFDAEREARAEAEGAQRALHNSEARMRRLVESNIGGVFYAESDGRITDANDAFLEMVGYTREDLEAGAVRWDRMTPEIYAEVDRRALADLRRYGACDPFEKEYIRKDGSRIHVYIGVAVVDAAEETYVCFAIDITERKRAESALRRSEERFRTLVGSIDDLVITLDTDGCYTGVYGRWLTRMGIDPATLIGRTAREIYGEEDARAHEEANSRALAGEHVVYGWTLPGAAEPRYCETSLSPIRDEAGEVIGIVGVGRDVTEQRRWEIELSEAKESAEAASRAKDQFLAVLSHELRTPLTPVLAAVQAIEDDEELGENNRFFLGIIHRNVELEARLIDDLLDLTRIERGKVELNLEIVDAHALIGSVIDICREDIVKRKLDLVADLAGTQHHVVADSARLQQVFWNLIKNAVKFTPEGGRITVRSANLSDGRLRVEVEDTGIGIDREILPRIFDAFEQGSLRITRQFGGLGLGLAISRAITELHGGTLAAASRGKGEGATFSVELATTAAAPPERAHRETAGEVAAGTNHDGEEPADHADPITGARILLVDDHRDTNRVLQLYLRRQGYQVHSAYSVRSALVLASGVDFDLVISDIGLPDGSGVELMRELRKLKPVKGIALSGYGLAEDVEKSLEVGFAEHLTKPVSSEKLREAIVRLLS